jgi:hypothetical protein
MTRNSHIHNAFYLHTLRRRIFGGCPDKERKISFPPKNATAGCILGKTEKVKSEERNERKDNENDYKNIKVGWINMSLRSFDRFLHQ